MELKKLETLLLNLLDKALYPIPQELNELDWKLDITHKNDYFKRHLSAFANYRNGGFIVFGISDDGIIEGISKEKAQTIAQKVSSLARDGVDPGVKTQFISFEYQKKGLWACFIYESLERPVYVLNNGKIGSAYVRAGGTTRPMERHELRESILSSRPLRYEEIPANLTEDALLEWHEFFDFSEVKNRLNRVDSSSWDHFCEFLFNHKILVKIEGRYRPTNLAIMVCAKSFSQLWGYEKLGIRLLQYKGINKLSAIKDETYNMGYSLSLDQLVGDIIKLLPHNEIIEQATTTLVPVIPPVAIREIISNAIIHRDYSKNDSYVSIEIFDDRVEITNPGSLLPELDVDRLIDHPSRTRNEVLADFMRKLHFAEERGSGIDKVVEACEVFSLPPLKFINEKDYFRVILYMPRDFSDMDKEERNDAIYQHACLNYVISRKTTNKTIRNRFKFSDRQGNKVSRLIKEAINNGKIKLANPNSVRKSFYYIPYWA